MTRTHTELNVQQDLTRRVLSQTAEAWRDGFGAVLDQDVHTARKVMRGAPVRRSSLRTAHQRLQWHEESLTTRGGRRSAPLHVVSDLMHINRLLGQLAQYVIAESQTSLLLNRDRPDVEIARRLGSERLRYLAESMPLPTIDRLYIRSGHELLDALANLAGGAPTRGTATDVCLALMVALLDTSRDATRLV